MFRCSCGVHKWNHNGSTYVQWYLDQMEIFEDYYPNVTFVYTTGNAQAYAGAGLQRHQNNEMIRNYCIANNKVLFDFGDLDSWYDGQQQTTTYNGTTYQVQHNAFDGQECGHVNLLGAEYKARAIWWMMARIRGWNHPLTNNPNIIPNQTILKLYPNPPNEIINIEFENQEKGALVISVLDMRGAVIIREVFEKSDVLINKCIDISYLKKGLYIVNILHSDETVFDRFIKL